MPIKRREVKSHFRRTFHPVFRHLRRQVVQTFVYDMLSEYESEFIEWLYIQLKEFIEFQEDAKNSDLEFEEEEEEEDVYVTDKGFPIPPEQRLDDLEEEAEKTFTSELNASAIENRSLIRAEEEEKKKAKSNYVEPSSSSSSSSDDDDDEDEKSESENGTKLSPAPKTKILKSDLSDNLDSSSSFKTAEESSIKEGPEGSSSMQYSVLTEQKLEERGGNFRDGKVTRVLGQQHILEPVDESGSISGSSLNKTKR